MAVKSFKVSIKEFENMVIAGHGDIDFNRIKGTKVLSTDRQLEEGIEL